MKKGIDMNQNDQFDEAEIQKVKSKFLKATRSLIEDQNGRHEHKTSKKCRLKQLSRKLFLMTQLCHF